MSPELYHHQMSRFAPPWPLGKILVSDPQEAHVCCLQI